MNENDIQSHNEIDESQEAQAEEIIQELAESQEQPEEEQALVSGAEEILCEEPQMDEPVKKKQMKTGAIVAITAAATVAICAIVLFVCAKFLYNPYNAKCKYMPTIKDYAEYNNMSVDEFKSNYHMPSDMPEDTYAAVAEYYIPVSYLAQQQGVDVDTYISSIGMSEEYSSKITESTTLGELNELYEEYSASSGEN